MSVQYTAVEDSGADFLEGGGEMGERMRSRDWSQTPLGPVENWPRSLKTSISIMLASRFAMVVAWGPKFRFFYNDRYRPVLGATKHPTALGTGAQEIFPEAWPFIGPRFESTRQGESVALDDVLIPLDRYGYLENCYFTLSYSPIRDETGGVGGMLAVVAETTERVEGERRLKTLRELARRAAEVETPEQACRNAAACVEANPIDVPFCLFYLLDKETQSARLVCSAGILPGTPATPLVVEAKSESAVGWPLHEVAASRQVCVLSDLPQRFGNLPAGPYPEPAHTAVLMPLTRPGQPNSDGILVFGVSPRRAIDDSYRGFFDLAADHILTGIRNSLAHQEERQRALALAELDRAKTVFFNNVSHEFRTPLTLMLGPLENLLCAGNDALSPQAQEQVETAHRNSLRLLKLVNTLLDFSRIEAGRIDAAYEAVDLPAYTTELASAFRSTIESAGLRFQVDCAPLDEPLYVDRDMWEKIVLNLLSNAFKFTHHGTIAIRLHRGTNGTAKLVVEDTGTGIPSEELPHIFKRFHRVKGARGRTYEGTGIGLALVQELVRLHGGTVQVESMADSGSTFTVSIPLGKAHLPPQRIGAAPALASTGIGAAGYLEEAQRWLSNSASEEPVRITQKVFAGAEPVGEKSRVLLADDNGDMRDYVARMLSPQFHIVCTPDGQAALEEARKQKPDLILSDIMMPQLDGLGLIQAVRSDPDLRTTPIILLSARAGEEARVSGLSAGADDYLVKPFSSRELMARVQTHIRMSMIRRQAERTIRCLKEELQVQLERERARAAELEALMSALPASVFIAKDPDGEVILGSRAAYELLRLPQGTNLSSTALSGECRQFRIYRNGIEIQPQEGPVKAAAQGVDAKDLELEVVFDDSVRTHLYGNAVPMRDHEGRLRGSIATFVDITERKRAEQRLALQYEVVRIVAGLDSLEEALRRILEVMGQSLGWDEGAAWSLDPEAERLRCVTLWHRPSMSFSHFEAVSRQMEFPLGTGLPGRVWATREPAWIEDVTVDSNFPRIQSAAREGLHAALAFPVGLQDECLGVIEFFSRKIIRPDAALLKMLGAVGTQVGQFIKRKRMEAERRRLLANEQSARAQLEEEREVLETVNHSGRMLSGELNLQRLVQTLTDDATEITGAQVGSFFCNASDDRGTPDPLHALSRVPPEYCSNFPTRPVTDLFGPGFPIDGTVRIHDLKDDPQYVATTPFRGMADGPLNVKSYLAVPVISRSGDVLGGLFFGHSRAGVFTERHELIVKGLAAQAAIAIDNARLYETAQKATQDAEEANRLKDEFLATVSHELRTPLNAMLGWARLLRTGKLDEDKKIRALEVLERNAVAQQQIIEDILDASRIITGKLRLEISPIEIAPVVLEAIASMKPSADAKGLRVQTAIDAEPHLILGDPSRLQQVVWNLLSNAVKFTPKGGEIHVAVEPDKRGVQISVRDSGRGISQDFQPFVFERFRQADSSTTRQIGGLGLGLAIVRHLVELHGGAVTVSSPGENQGSTFTVTLPLAVLRRASSDKTGAQQSFREKRPALDSWSLDGVRVLAVDDEADVRELLTVMLRECGADVRTAASSDDALKTIGEWQPHVLISDIGMPDEDGLALIRRVRALPFDQGAEIQAAALTAYARTDDRAKALAAGYQAHVTKPVEPAELISVVAALAGRRRTL